MKTSELTGAALNWAVAGCEGRTILQFIGGGILVNGRTEIGDELPQEQGFNYMWHPSTNWAQGGPIIERECIELTKSYKGNWVGYKFIPSVKSPTQIGDAPLIAAMRCYVASKLGDEVEIPKELQN